MAAFLSGLLLTHSGIESNDSIHAAVFEAWCIGLLSASLPFRMLCAFTTSGILNQNPGVLGPVVEKFPTLRRFFKRLPSTVARRFWAERAALPVCSRYAQAMAELACAVENAAEADPKIANELQQEIWVDAATPLPLEEGFNTFMGFWESQHGFVSDSEQWDILLGSVEIDPVDWKTPAATSVHGSMENGEGPPMVREGCIVMRGVDWDQNNYDDGKDIYDLAKAKRDQAKKKAEQPEKGDVPVEGGENATKSEKNIVKVGNEAIADPISSPEETNPKTTESKMKKLPGPKLPVGTVMSIADWGESKGKALRIKWTLTGKEGTYRFGGDGGRFDVCHVEVNNKGTKVKKRHPLPESAEQCASRHGFGKGRNFNIILRARRKLAAVEMTNERVDWEGVLEWPDFCAGILVHGSSKTDGSMLLEERKLLFGSKDSGWEARFGQPSFAPGTTFVLKPKSKDYQDSSTTLSGATTFEVKDLRNPRDGGRIYVNTKMSFPRSIWTTPSERHTPPQPLTFDRSFKSSSLLVSKDGRTITCSSADGRASAFASIGFSKGIHYWEVKVEQTNDIGCVFIGVAEKPTGTGSGSAFRHETVPKLNKWHGYGFVNFRATYATGAERVYGTKSLLINFFS